MRSKILSLLAMCGIALMLLVSVGARFTALDRKALMHDESLFAYYAYSAMKAAQDAEKTPAGEPRPVYYTHIPMLHGPTLMLATGTLWHWLGDSGIRSARAMVGLVALAGLLAGLAAWPRRYRWWLAPLLLSSPIMLYYSRFFRDDMMISATYLLATLGVARALGGNPRWRPLWAVVGGCFILLPLALMESALFFQAAGVTFAVVALASRWLWRGQSLGLRLPHRRPARVYQFQEERSPDKTARRRRHRESQQERGLAAVAVQTPPETLAESAPEGATPASPIAAAPLAGKKPGWLSNLTGWVAGLMLGAVFVLFVYGVTYNPAAPPDDPSVPVKPTAAEIYHKVELTHPRLLPLAAPLLNLRASWYYWKDQHKQHRIDGPIHYHLPILATYELPVLLLLAAGLAWDALRRRQRFQLQAAFIGGWLFFWALWRAVSYKEYFSFDPLTNPHVPPSPIKPVTDFLHVEPNLSMLILGLLIAPLLAWSIMALRERRTLGAWTGWWAACSLFQYSSAGEKVPWLAIHMALPIYMALGWVWAPHLLRMRRWGLAVAIGLLAAATAIGARNDYYLIGERAADPHERLVYNHTPTDFDKLCRDRTGQWAQAEAKQPQGIKLKDRNVLLVGDTGWPGVWYFRQCKYQLLPSAPADLAPDTDLIMGNEDLMRPLLAKLDPKQWVVIQPPMPISYRPGMISLRDHWMAPWPSENFKPKTVTPPGTPKSLAGTILEELDKSEYSIKSWWNYYWFRETWTEPGYFQIVAIEPLRPR